MTSKDRFLVTFLDLGLALPGLLAISPFLLLIALAVMIDSPGPAIYRRKVMGRGGDRFDAYKFRTMHIDGERILDSRPGLRAELAAAGKLRRDPRVTRIGRFLRRFSLDELPQLFNVLRREMSLVGPRMISLRELERYGASGDELLTVRPGLTGLWQVSGRSEIGYEERVRLDLHYIRTRTILGDLVLLLRSVPAVLSGRGAW